MTFAEIGRKLDELEAQLTSEDASVVLDAWGRGGPDPAKLRVFVRRGVVRGALLSWELHRLWLAITAIPSRDILEEWRNAANDWAGRVVGLAAATYRTGVGPMDPPLYLDLTARIAIRRGWGEGANSAATVANAQFKTWVRAYPSANRRDWHDALNGTSILANRRFVLPGGPNAGKAVSAPHDWQSLADPREWANCGHIAIYTTQANRSRLRIQ